MENITKNVILRCPVCASDQFHFDKNNLNDLIKCPNCKSEFSLEELKKMNNTQFESVKKDICKEAQKQIVDELKNIFKKR